MGTRHFCSPRLSHYLNAAGAILAVGIASSAPAWASGPGFDCTKATLQVEKSICNWDTVRSLDGKMTEAYRAALAAQNNDADRTALMSGQREWLSKRNRQCALDAVTPDPTSEEGLSPREMGQLMCLQGIYASRIEALSTAAPTTDPWVGSWSGKGSGMLSATIRRGTAKPDYLVVDLITGMPGCSGAVTLYGKPAGRALHGASYDPIEPSAPVCDINFDLDASGTLNVDAYGDCNYYHGGGCIFDGTLTKDK